MIETTSPSLKKFSFGGCDIGQTSPDLGALKSDTQVLNIRIGFEEALKLHLAIGECIRKLNSYQRREANGLESRNPLIQRPDNRKRGKAAPA